MHTTVLISPDKKRAIMLRSFHRRNTPRPHSSQSSPRGEVDYHSRSYRDALQRAFNNAKRQVFFNPDMTNFVTLTYRGSSHTADDVMADIKVLVRRESRSHNRPLKYIWIMEYQKRGSIHVHMICNDGFTTNVNKNGYHELTFWNKGFSSFLPITDFDSNFCSYLYLFKYMRKSIRIGKSFVHSSRNLNNYTDHSTHAITLMNWRTINQEYTHSSVEGRNFHYFTNFLLFDDTMTL